MLSVVMLSATNKYFKLSVVMLNAVKLNVVMLNAVKLNVVILSIVICYAEYSLFVNLSNVMLSIVMLSIVMLSIAMLSARKSTLC
jgi:hypothetical protein